MEVESPMISVIRNSSQGESWLRILVQNNMMADSVLETIDPHWFRYAPTPMTAHTLMALFVALVATASTLGNALVIVIFMASHNLRKSGVYTVNLAVSDFLSPVLSYYLFTGTSFKQIWTYGKTACVFYGFTQGFFGLMSIVTLAVISAERCYVILKPFRARDILTRHRVAITVGIWIYCALVAGPPVVGWSKYAPAGFLTSCCFDYLGRHWVARSFILYLFVFGFIIPVIVIIYSYIQIFQVVHKSEKGAHIAGSKHAGSQGRAHNQVSTKQEPDVLATAPESDRKSKSLKKQVRKDVQMAKVMLIVILTFVLAWTPYAAVAILGQFAPVGILTPFAAMAPAIFAKTSTLYNPIIYAYKDPKFRTALASSFPFVTKILKANDADSLSGDNSRMSLRRTGKGSVSRGPKTRDTGVSMKSAGSCASAEDTDAMA